MGTRSWDIRAYMHSMWPPGQPHYKWYHLPNKLYAVIGRRSNALCITATCLHGYTTFTSVIGSELPPKVCLRTQLMAPSENNDIRQIGSKYSHTIRHTYICRQSFPFSHTVSTLCSDTKLISSLWDKPWVSGENHTGSRAIHSRLVIPVPTIWFEANMILSNITRTTCIDWGVPG